MFSYFEPNFIEKISSGKCFFKFWSRVYFHEIKIRFFLAAILKRNAFWIFFLLIYGCFKCIQIWCKFQTEIFISDSNSNRIQISDRST